ncbi:hypothetical protein V5H21_17220 [Vibrio cholerae]|uniref:hypothetical protein n=1 Tax=Vibrio cholerae TaxID=666 RepID=UPI003966D5B5|nr:hypothetical protein [Vibrio cholerae]
MASRFEELQWLLIDIVTDLLAPSQVFVEEVASELYMPINRMCLSQIVISLCRFDEVYCHYGLEFKQLPDHLLVKIRNIKKEIENRKMYSFRSTYIGHAFKKGSSQKTPLTSAEIQSGLNQVIDNDQVAFFDWIFPLDENVRNGESVVEVLNEAAQFFMAETSVKKRL